MPEFSDTKSYTFCLAIYIINDQMEIFIKKILPPHEKGGVG